MALARLDHLVICAETLDEGSAHVSGLLGVAPAGGGAHEGRGTHNRLLSLGPETYLEVIAPNPAEPNPDCARMFDLDNFSGQSRLQNWALRCDDIGAAMALAPEEQGEITPLARGDFRWDMSVPASGKLPFEGAFPGLIRWHGTDPGPLLPDQGCRLAGLTISHPEAGQLQRALEAFLNEPRLRIVAGAPGFEALIDTPLGRKVLV